MSGGKSASNLKPFHRWKLKMKPVLQQINGCELCYPAILKPTWNDHEGVAGIGLSRINAYQHIDRLTTFSGPVLKDWTIKEKTPYYIVSVIIKGLCYVDNNAKKSRKTKEEYLREYYTGDVNRAIGEVQMDT
tara:strand:+ start:4045 stop:4440 length:396 start_codon:yes stop_codon:yes gene_type:complete